jgi:hypothetical protein
MEEARLLLEAEEARFYDMLAQANPFFPVKTWKDICAVNVRFLKKEISETYYHLGPTDPETEPLLPALIRLNELGCYTTNGQPGVIEDENKQKAFIDFHVESHEVGAALLQYLKGVDWVEYMYSEYQPRKFETNIPGGQKKLDLTDEYHTDIKKWKMYSSRTVEWEFESDLSDMPNVDGLLKDSGHFVIAHRKWGKHESLEEMLLKFFEK